MKRLRFKSINKNVQNANKDLLGSVKETVKKQLRQQLRSSQQLKLAGVGFKEDTGTVGRNTTTPSLKPSNTQPSQNGLNKKTIEDRGTGNVIRNLDDLKNTDAFKKGTTSNALNHIFEGENIKGQAVGFHYEGMPNSKGKIVGNVDPPNEYGVYRANVEVDGTLKKAKTTFFPKDWTPQQVIDEII